MKAKYSLDRNHIHLFEKPKDDEFCKLDILSEIRYNKENFVEEASELLDYVKRNNIKEADTSNYVYNSAIRGQRFCEEYTRMLKN